MSIAKPTVINMTTSVEQPPLTINRGGGQSLYVRISSALMLISILSAIAFGSYVIAWLVQHNDFATLEGVWAIAAIFVGIAVPLSLHDIHLHLTHYYSPLQRFYVRILWMIPVYSLQSWLALRFKKERIYLVAWRECFEAYVLWSFFHLMLGFLGGKRSLGARLRLRAKKTGEEYLAHLPPCSWCCRRGWSSGSRFVHRSAVGVYTYVLLRVLCTIIIVIAELAHVFKEEWANPVYAITTVIINVAQFAALYCLAIFYARLHDELMPMKVSFLHTLLLTSQTHPSFSILLPINLSIISLTSPLLFFFPPPPLPPSPLGSF